MGHCPLQECTEIHDRVEGVDLEMQEGVHCTRKVCSPDRHTGDCTDVAQPRCASCRRRKQPIQRGCGVAPMICIEY